MGNKDSLIARIESLLTSSLSVASSPQQVQLRQLRQHQHPYWLPLSRFNMQVFRQAAPEAEAEPSPHIQPPCIDIRGDYCMSLSHTTPEQLTTLVLTHSLTSVYNTGVSDSNTAFSQQQKRL